MIPFTSFLVPFLNSIGYLPLECNSEQEAKSMMNHISSGKYPVYLFDSDTSGEKTYEEFFTKSEIIRTDNFKRLGVISKKAQYSRMKIDEIIQELELILTKKNLKKKTIVSVLKKYIPEFQHIEKGLSLDNKM
jgi:hypothetical protein